jgi:sterol desaturase/sphingolipid hydroxylase (fatty acid hydroxylase superfamily)
MEIVPLTPTAMMDFTVINVFLTVHPPDVLILNLTEVAITFVPISKKFHLLHHRRLPTFFDLNYTGKRGTIGKKKVSNASFV